MYAQLRHPSAQVAVLSISNSGVRMLDGSPDPVFENAHDQC
jgi:hypothetical protein